MPSILSKTPVAPDKLDRKSFDRMAAEEGDLRFIDAAVVGLLLVGIVIGGAIIIGML